MRPVRRGASPKAEDYEDYSDAKTDLISRISSGQFKERHIAAYCSYCERKIDTNLAVEHIEPKK
ncbi:MAG: HNH endonuclease, partial [Methyloprofundus sp.]|nr:HNH endonuclease [Methyloprofundus sp.]